MSSFPLAIESIFLSVIKFLFDMLKDLTFCAAKVRLRLRFVGIAAGTFITLFFAN